MPEFHRLNKSKTTEISKAELDRRLNDEVSRPVSSRKKPKKAAPGGKRDKKISEQTKKQMPPMSPARKKRAQELKKREKLEKKEKKKEEQRKKRRKHGNNVIYYVFLGIIAAVIFAILSVTVLFNSEKIIVEGETIYTDEDIIAASGLTGTENLVRLSLSGISERILDELPSLDSAVVSKQFPNAIKISVMPAEPMANFYYAGQNYVISHVGRVMQIERDAADCMEVIGYQPGDSVVVGDYITAANPEQDKIVSTISAALEELDFQKITRLDIKDSLSIVITYDNRVYIKIGNILSLNEKLSMAKEIVENYLQPGERVTLDVTSAEHVVQRPITLTADNAPSAPVTEKPVDPFAEGSEPENP